MIMQRILQVVLALVLLAPMAAVGTAEKGHRAQVRRGSRGCGEKRKGEKVVKRVDVAKATATVPGDTVVFTTHYTNTGKQPATNVVITNPIDEHMTYVDHSAEGSNTRIEFSTDGGKTYSAPEKLMVKNAQGMVRQARAEDYTGIRWTVTKPLAAGGPRRASHSRRRLQ